MKSIFLIFSISIFQSFVFSQASPVLKHQRLDFEQFQQAFYKLEAKPFLHISEKELQENFQKLREDLRSPLSPLEQFRVYAAFVSRIQCGHTSVIPSKKVIREWGIQKQCLPFDVVMVNKKLFIAPMHPEDFLRPKKGEKVELKKPKKAKEKLDGGTEIYAIDQKSIAEWMKLISPYISSDEDGIDFKYFNVGQLFDFYRYVALPVNKDSVEVRYIYKKDTLSQFVKLRQPLFYTLQARLDPKISKEKEKEFGTFSIEKNKYGYFRFESFKNGQGDKYEAFLKSAFEAMKKKKIDKLIIDLRGNTGGIIQTELLRYFVPAGTDAGKYTFEKQLSRKELRKLGVKMNHEATKTYLKNMKMSQKMLKKSNAYNGNLIVSANFPEKYKGEIVVITDEGTFSAASVLACHLKTLAGAKIVGQTPGGSFYGGNAGTLQLHLKKSDLFIQLNPNFFKTQLDLPAEQDSSIKTPDLITFSETSIPAEKFTEYKKKVNPTDDPVIKAAEKLMK